MQYLALASDYDGTLAKDGEVREQTIVALRRFRSSGRVLLLVTGRQLDELRRIFPNLPLFARIVAENGALVYDPASGEETVLGKAPPLAFVRDLRTKGVPAASGRVIVASREPYTRAIQDAIRDHALEHQVILNKNSVMVLPPGVDKAAGLRVALRQLRISARNVVAVGDAENDEALLSMCECGVAVANALPSLKEKADYVTSSDHGAGVEELIELMLSDDLNQNLSNLHAKSRRNALPS